MKRSTRLIFTSILCAMLWSTAFAQSSISLNPSGLGGVTLNNPTSLQFGPDNRLYVSQQDGTIYAYSIQRNGPGDFIVTATETIQLIKSIPNHDDDGTLNTTVTTRQVTGILVKGTETNPILYVSSSDPRIGGGGTGGDKNLDTNSGIVSKLTWNGTSWTKVDLVIGLPRSEENHAVNGMQLDEVNNILYLAVGGHTNAGAPSNNFAFITEYALAAAILKINLTQIENDFGGSYILPTLDDPSRANTGPNGSDVNDPFGGNDGLNQAKLVVGGPVQIHSPGYRNAYDLVITRTPGKEGRMYTIDNGANGGWGGHPDQEGASGDPLTTSVTNNYVVGEPGSTTPGPNDAKVNNKDNLHLVSKPGMTPIYGGHPTPIRANPAGAGLFWYDNNTSTAHFELTPTVDWPPVPLALANPVEGDFRNPGVDDGALAIWNASTNGIAEYTSTKFFNGEMAGDLLAASFDGIIYRIKLNNDGTAVEFVEPLASGFGSIPLDVIAQGTNEIYEGSIWAVTYGSNDITIFEPAGQWQFVETSDESGPIGRHENSFVEANGKFYLIGGRESKDLDIYDPVLNKWTKGQSAPITMHHFQATTWQNKIYVMGAYTGSYSSGNVNNSESPVPNIYIYDISTNTWTQGPAIPRQRGSAGLVVYNDEFYLVSGIINGHQDGWVKWVDKYNPTTNEWTELSDVPRERDHFQAVVLGGKIYLTGGRKTNGAGNVFGVTIPEVDVYDIATDTWETLSASSNLITQRAGTSSVIFNNEIYLIGGESTGQSIAHNECEVFNPVSKMWRPVASLNTGRHGTGAVVYNKSIYTVVGSANQGGGPILTTMESLESEADCVGDVNDFNVDDDGDGFSNGDETLNGTNPCSASSKPTDFDGDLLSDLIDPDDDNDSILDEADLFALDASNGLGTSIPLFYPFLNGDPGTGLYGLGFTGLMNNGVDNYQDLFDPSDPDLIMGGAVGIASVPANAGDAVNNDQQYAFQYGFKIEPSAGKFTIKSKLQGTPFFDGIALNDLEDQTQGIYIGTGDQDNYLKLVLAANSGNPGIQVFGENNGVEFINEMYPVANILTTGILYLYFEIDPATSEAMLYYQTGADVNKLPIGTSVTLPSFFANILNGTKAMATGIIASSGSAPSFSASWDYINITTANPYVVEDAPNFYNRIVGNPTAPFSIDLTQLFIDEGGSENLSFEIVSVESNTFISSNAITNGVLTFNFNPNEVGSAEVVVEATNANLLAGTYKFRMQIIEEPTPFLRINAGGDKYYSWQTDTYFTDGSVYSNNTAITNSTDDILYQTERFGDEFEYQIPISKPGYYKLNLHFAEIYHGVINTGGGIGSRVFNVEVEGKPTLTNYDIFQAAGGARLAVVEGIDSIYVEDGQLSLRFIAVQDNAKISAIEVASYSAEPTPNVAPVIENPGTRYVFEGGFVNFPIIAYDLDSPGSLLYEEIGLPASLSLDPNTGIISGTVEVNENDYPVGITVTDSEGGSSLLYFNINVVAPEHYSYRINSGGTLYTFAGTEIWESDRYFSLGSTIAKADEIENTNKDQIYQSERWGDVFGYEIPMPGSAKYKVTLHFAELLWNAPGQRVFDVDIEDGQAILNDYDIIAKAGAPFTAVSETFEVDVTDGYLSLFFEREINRAKISGIEISTCVDPIIASVTSSSPQICAGETVTITVNGSLGTASMWNLYSSSCGGTLVASNTTGVFELTPAQTTTYYVRSEGGCDPMTTCFPVTVNVKVVNTEVTLANNVLTATISGAAYEWINCDGDTVIPGENGQSFAPTESGSYAVRITHNGCTAVSECIAVCYDVEPVITSFTSSASTPVCAGTTVTLTVAGSLESANAWFLYSTSCGGTPVASNTTGVFEVSPTITTTYFVRGEGDCLVPATCSSVEVVVNSVNTEVTVTGATLTANLAGATYQWINCDGNIDIVGETNQSLTVTADGIYAVRITANGCTEVSTCTIVIVCEVPSITDFTSSANDVCSGTSITLTATGDLGSATSWNLYSGSCGGTLVASNTTGIFTVAPTQNTSYFVRPEGGCVTAGTCLSIDIAVKQVNTAVTINGNTLTASATDATYQWINCDGNTDISGETGKTFTPQESGSYAVRVTSNGCTATSACVAVVIVGVKESVSDKVTVYPNPVRDRLVIELPASYANVAFDLTDVTGRTAWRATYDNVKTVEVDTQSMNPGVYLLRVNSAEIRTTIKVLIR